MAVLADHCVEWMPLLCNIIAFSFYSYLQIQAERETEALAHAIGGKWRHVGAESMTDWEILHENLPRELRYLPYSSARLR